MPQSETVMEQVLRYVREQYGVEPEFLWAKTPGNGVFRHRSNQKWFGALLRQIPGKKLGLTTSEPMDILNVKCGPLMLGSLVDGKSRLPGYHMNKEHWVSLLLDGSVPLSEICALLDLSYTLTAPRKTQLPQKKRSAR